jgi:hypothetical protein
MRRRIAKVIFSEMQQAGFGAGDGKEKTKMLEKSHPSKTCTPIPMDH